MTETREERWEREEKERKEELYVKEVPNDIQEMFQRCLSEKEFTRIKKFLIELLDRIEDQDNLLIDAMGDDA